MDRWKVRVHGKVKGTQSIGKDISIQVVAPDEHTAKQRAIETAKEKGMEEPLSVIRIDRLH